MRRWKVTSINSMNQQREKGDGVANVASKICFKMYYRSCYLLAMSELAQTSLFVLSEFSAIRNRRKQNSLLYQYRDKTLPIYKREVSLTINHLSSWQSVGKKEPLTTE